MADGKCHGICDAVAAALLARSCVKNQGFQEPSSEGREGDVTHPIAGPLSPQEIKAHTYHIGIAPAKAEFN